MGITEISILLVKAATSTIGKQAGEAVFNRIKAYLAQRTSNNSEIAKALSNPNEAVTDTQREDRKTALESGLSRFNLGTDSELIGMINELTPFLEGAADNSVNQSVGSVSDSGAVVGKVDIDSNKGVLNIGGKS